MRRRISALPLAASVAAGALLIVGLLVSRGPDPDAVPTAEEVATRTMSPFCPGLTLDECPSQQASELRSKIARRIDDGATNREIDAFLVSNYGEAVIGRPKRIAVWLVPALGLPLALLAVAFGLGRGRQESESPGPAEVPLADDGRGGDGADPLRARMREDFERFSEGTDE